MGDTNSPDIIQRSLAELNQLRHDSNRVFQTAAEGVKDTSGDEAKEKKFLSNLKQQIDTVSSSILSVETNLSQPTNLPTTLLLGNLDSDSAVESFTLYTSLSKSYKWLDKAHDYAAGAAAHLSQNSLKRSYGAVTKSRRRNPNTSHNAPTHHLNSMIEGINKMFPDMKLSISRPGNTKLNAIVEVNLDRILKAVLIFKGMMIEWVVVKGWEEELVRQDSQPDIWGESRFVLSILYDNIQVKLILLGIKYFKE